jgi:hypothetical protein
LNEQDRLVLSPPDSLAEGQKVNIAKDTQQPEAGK